MKTIFIGLALVLCATVSHAQTVYELDGIKLKIIKKVEEVKSISMSELLTSKVRAQESLQRIYDEYVIEKQELLDKIVAIDLQIVEAGKLGIVAIEEVTEIVK